MKKILLFMFVLSVFSTHSLAFGNYSAKKQNYLKKNFVASTTSQYDPMDVLGILNILIDAGESVYIPLGLTWDDITEAINGNPDAMIEKANKNNSSNLPFIWKASGKYKVLKELNLFYTYSMSSFDGKYFKNLEILDLPPGIKYLNVSKNYMLKELHCGLSHLTNIDMSNNPNLEILEFFDCEITSLNITKNPKLKELYCSQNNLKVLDVSKNSVLEVIECDSNQIIALDVSNNPELTTLNCGFNKITVLDVSKNSLLKDLSCDTNQLTALDVSKNPKLEFFHCEENQLKVLDMSNNSNLDILLCYENQLKFSTLKGNFSKLHIFSTLGPQALLKGGTKGFFELIDLSNEYNINGTLTTFKWYDKATNQEVGVFASKGTFYAGPGNAGKTLICKMTNTLYPGLILEYEVIISNSMTQGFSAKTMDFKIPENFILTNSKAEASNLKIFPNPVVDILKINTPLHIETVSVFDYSGNEVKKISPVSSKEVNLQGLSSGNYILTIQTSQGVITKKIIKK